MNGGYVALPMLRRFAALTEYVCNGGGESKGKRSSSCILNLVRISSSNELDAAKEKETIMNQNQFLI